MNLCSKPRCARPGAVALAYDYAGRRAVLHDPPEGEMSPHLYSLCGICAEKLRPPRGWTLADERTEPPLFVTRDQGRRPERWVVAERPQPEPAVGRTTFFGSSA